VWSHRPAVGRPDESQSTSASGGGVAHLSGTVRWTREGFTSEIPNTPSAVSCRERDLLWTMTGARPQDRFPGGHAIAHGIFLHGFRIKWFQAIGNSLLIGDPRAQPAVIVFFAQNGRYPVVDFGQE
jgi:hypothetical protein